jgi:hypothetical protein
LAEIGTDMYVRHLQAHVFSGVYILENTSPPPRGGGGEVKITVDVIWGRKHETGRRKKGGNLKEIGRQEKENGRK